MVEEVADGIEAARNDSRFRLPAAFQSLRYRNYRLLWFGQLVSSSGDWMDQVALNWLVVSQLYDGREAALPVAILNASRLVPILVFTPIGGVLADRLERRRLMFTTQAVAMVLAFILATLVATGVVEFWMVLAVAVGRGIMLSFNMPARQSLISELVPPESLMNAIALNSATLNLTRVGGPLIAALFFITPLGIAGAFYFNGLTFVAVLAGLAIMAVPPQPKRVRSGMLSDLFGGFAYINRTVVLRTLVVLATVPMIFGMPYQAMSAVVAKDVLGAGGEGFAVLTAATGVGAVTGALFIASLRSTARKGWITLGGLCSFGIAIIVFAASSWFIVSVVAIAAVGVSQQIYLASNNTLLQLHAEDEYRGRVMSTLFLSRGMVPLGTLIAGLAATAVGVQWALAGMASVLVILALVTARFVPRVRAL
jgi:MFS transporter, DHA1 family, staphyloferrin A biosynthesis exporter